jgi:60 kDa SS-A/Ro ribonucleoprotein
LTKFATKVSNVQKQLRSPAVTLNYEGGIAYKQDARHTLAKMAACCLVNEQSFYEDTTGKVFQLVQAVGQEFPEWLVKLAVFLREELKLRSIPQFVTAVCLSLPAARDPIKKAFDRLTPRTDDLLEIAALLKDGKHGLANSLPHISRRLFAKKLNQLTEIDVIKYRKSSQFGLKHLIRTVHPKPTSERQKLLFQYILARTKVWETCPGNLLNMLPQIFRLEELKSTSRKDKNAICLLIEEGRLPWEVVIPVVGSKKVFWESCVKNMPIMALIRNLRNLYFHGLLKQGKTRRLILDKLKNKEVILNSKQLPFRWLSAYKAIEGCDQEICDALISALEISAQNLPRFSGHTFISCDNSGSMTMAPISARSSLYPADIGNLLGAMVLYLSEHGCASVFGEDFAVVSTSKKDSILTNWQRLKDKNVGYATNSYKAIEFLVENKYFTDRIIILTDMIIYRSDAFEDDSTSFMSLLQKYRRQVNPKVRTYIVNLQPYEYFISPADDLRVTTISGWSESILKYIEYDSSLDHTDVVDIIGRIKL